MNRTHQSFLPSIDLDPGLRAGEWDGEGLQLLVHNDGLTRNHVGSGEQQRDAPHSGGVLGNATSI